ncbi:MAG: hypothetical protein AABY78_06890 [Nitrospirota bacterium]
MVFDYYKRLTASERWVYRKSDEITSVRLSKATELHPLVEKLDKVLTKEKREEIEVLCQKIVSHMTARLKAPDIRVKVLAVRPTKSYGELHGLYVPSEGQTPATITLWMRTAQKRKVVAFRTFLRTLLHEICHHLDYELLGLPYSFHTEGFYKRESSLFHQLVRKGIKRV